MMRIGSMEEMVFSPEDAKLVRYDFLSWKRAFPSYLARNMMDKFLKERDVMIRSIEFDMHKLISIFEKHTGFLVQDPTRLTDIYGDADTHLINDQRKKLYAWVMSNILVNRKVSEDGYDWADMKIQAFQNRRSWVRNPDEPEA